MNTIMRSFFEEYAKMSRSKEGLKAAGEWHQLKPLFPSLEGKSVLDLGVRIWLALQVRRRTRSYKNIRDRFK